MNTPPEKYVRVVLVEDHAATRAAIEKELGAFSARVQVVASFENGETFLKSPAARTVDVALIDLRLPGMSGTEVIRALGDTNPDVRALALTAFDDERNLFDALGAGAYGYLLKDESAERIASAIEEAAAGAHPISSRVAGFLVTYAQRFPPSVALSEREDELAALLAEGLTYAECATRMAIALGTVQDYVKRLYRKLGVNSRREVREWVERRARLS